MGNALPEPRVSRHSARRATAATADRGTLRLRLHAGMAELGLDTAPAERLLD